VRGHEHSNRWSHDLCNSSLTIERRLELRSIYLQSGQSIHYGYAHPNTDCKPYRESESNTDPHVKSIRYADTNPCTHGDTNSNS
jgi:hypothetical protein